MSPKMLILCLQNDFFLCLRKCSLNLSTNEGKGLFSIVYKSCFDRERFYNTLCFILFIKYFCMYGHHVSTSGERKMFNLDKPLYIFLRYNTATSHTDVSQHLNIYFSTRQNCVCSHRALFFPAQGASHQISSTIKIFDNILIPL